MGIPSAENADYLIRWYYYTELYFVIWVASELG